MAWWFHQIRQHCCLRSNCSLRRQLIAGYGITALITITIVVFTATITARKAGEEVKEESIELFKRQLDVILQESGLQTGFILDQKMESLRGSASLLTEIVRDRIVGYPNDGWEEDIHVPFIDRDTGKRRYPLKAKLLPRDWQITPNLRDVESLTEHIQERATYKGFQPYIDTFNTETAIFLFQGNCDPNQNNANESGFYPFCSNDYNNATIGGAINPTPTLAGLEQKAADIGVFLKAIFEAEPLAVSVSVIFFNSGAGASLFYPSEIVSFQSQYTSAGCDWMRNNNSYTGRPFGTQEEINRCSPAGFSFSMRQYNGMEREWCSDQALHPGEVRIYGPFSDANQKKWSLMIGKGVFDRRTGEFIGCTGVEMSVVQAENLLESISKDMPTDMVITRPDGTVVVGIPGNNNANIPTEIWKTNYIDEKSYHKLTDNLAFWEGKWDIESAIGLYNFSVKSNGKYYTVFPAPPPPEEYDKSYKPEFLIFGSIDAEAQDNKIDEIRKNIRSDVLTLVATTVVLGVAGLFCLLVAVCVVAQLLTQPLTWMEIKAWEIVNHTDKRIGDSLIVVQGDEKSPFSSFMPKTEVQEIVKEFRSMILGFSGKGASKDAVWIGTETRNVVTWKPFQEPKLQKETKTMASSVGRRMSRRRSSGPKLDTADFAKIIGFKDEIARNNAGSNVESKFSQVSGESTTELRTSTFTASSSMQKNDSEKFNMPPTRINLGSNFPSRERTFMGQTIDGPIRISKSPLYWNLLFWIVLPILISIIAIMTFVGIQLAVTFPSWINDANFTSFELELDLLNSSAHLNVKQIEQIFRDPLRDLHVISRISGWLLFGAVNRSSSFTDLEIEMVEECKFYSDLDACPFQTDNYRSPCACELNDPWNRPCLNTSNHPRDTQKMWYTNQKRDFDVTTGNRNESLSYPKYDNSPETTSWWTNPDEMPGSNKSSDAEGYLTTYERLRVGSAVATAIFPVYNAGEDARGAAASRLLPTTAMSAYISFEADGTLFGYAGCNYDTAAYANFQSTNANKAYLINPNLCPLGKFGYDPRCREWYADSKREALNNNDPVRITPPYKFATTDYVLNTAVSALIDPTSGEYIGNTFIDFSTSAIHDIVGESQVEFYAVILPNSTDGQNVVASSELDEDATPKSFFELLVPFDPPDSVNREYFSSIINDMEKGGKGFDCNLNRTNKYGVQEEYCYVYLPVYNRELIPVQPDDYSRGAEYTEELLYSIIMFEKKDELFHEFVMRSDNIYSSLVNDTLVVYILTTSLITFICIVITATISLYVTKPMIQLLRVVQQVNVGRIEDDIPPLTGGSREVHQVYTSFAKLYKTIRMSNSAFFFGDLLRAHRIALDAFCLFQKIGDQKAIAIACNNMGNTLLALMVESRKAGMCMNIDDGNCCTSAAINYYTEAVVAGKQDLDSVDSDAEKSQYAQQLADRYFNRAMCLFHTADDPCAVGDAKEAALDDLFLARQYDQGVKEYLLHSKTLFKNSDVIFDRSIRRLRGLAALIDIDPEVWNVWDIYELVDQADLILQAAWNHDDAPLFQKIKKIGRLQELEGAVMGIEQNPNDMIPLATRMLVEDEFILDNVFVVAADCILQYSRNNGGVDDEEKGTNKNWSDNSMRKLKEEFKMMRKPVMRTTLDIGRSFVFCIELSGQWNGTLLLRKLRNACIAFYDNNCRNGDSVGLVTFVPQDGALRHLIPATRAEEESAHREEIEAATTGVSCSKFCSVLPDAIDMAQQLESTTSSDVCLLYISDGGAYDEKLYTPLRDKIRYNASSMDLVVIGLEVENNESFVESCKSLSLATHSRRSTYIETNEDSINETFRQVSSLINSGTSFASNRLQHALTMQRF